MTTVARAGISRLQEPNLAQRVRAEPNVSRDHPPPVFVALATRFCAWGRRDGRTMSNSNPVSHIRADAQLAEHAAAIRALGKRAIGSTIDIGRRLIEAKALAGHGNWLPWLEREFGWAERTARHFMSVAELAAKSATVADLNIDVGALYLLAAPSTPPEVNEDVVARGQEGKRIRYEDVVDVMRAREIRVQAVVMRQTIVAPVTDDR